MAGGWWLPSGTARCRPFHKHIGWHSPGHTQFSLLTCGQRRCRLPVALSVCPPLSLPLSHFSRPPAEAGGDARCPSPGCFHPPALGLLAGIWVGSGYGVVSVPFFLLAAACLAFTAFRVAPEMHLGDQPVSASQPPL